MAGFWDNLGGEQGALGGALGSLFGSMFGGDSGPSPDSYLSQIPDQIKQYLAPYMNAGAGMLPGLTKQFGDLTSNPGGMINQIGKSYHQSPGFQFALQQAMQGNNRAAAAGGMAGSPMAQQLAQQKATQLGNQDYYNWLGQATGMYGNGLQGMQNLAGMGLNAGDEMAQAIAQALSAQAQNAQEQQAAGAQQGGGIGGMLGSIAGALPWASLF